MEWKDVGQAVKKFAPLLGSVLAGPAGTVAGGAVSLLCSAFGIEDENPGPETVLNSIQAHPEYAVKLREIELNNKIELGKIALQQEQMYLEDRQSARQADVDKTKATGKRDVNMYILAYLIAFGFFGLTGLLCFRSLPEGSTQAIFMLFGTLSTAFGAVVGYFFGSSKSSSEKTALLAKKQ